MSRNEMLKKKRDFVADWLSPALHEANRDLTCYFAEGKDISLTKAESYILIHPNEEYVVMTASNGYRYFINVTADSYCALAKEVFALAACK